jgi:hypothetical protein
MKKIFYTSSVLVALSLTLFTGCKKDTVAFPAKTQTDGTYVDLVYTTPYFPTVADADGILIAAQVTNQKTVIVSPFSNEYEYGMAKFTNATGNFSNLTDAGSITVNDSVLTKTTALEYLSSITNYTLNFSNQSAWNISGNSSNNIPALTYTLTGSNPSYTLDITSWNSNWTPSYPQSLVTDSNVLFTIPIKQYTSNADSVAIAMADNNGFSYHRTVSANDAVAKFRANDFAGYSTYDLKTFNLQVNAIKYNSTAAGTKKYYFLKMQANIKYYQATK